VSQGTLCPMTPTPPHPRGRGMPAWDVGRRARRGGRGDSIRLARQGQRYIPPGTLAVRSGTKCRSAHIFGRLSSLMTAGIKERKVTAPGGGAVLAPEPCALCGRAARRSREGTERTLGAWDSHDVRSSADRREGKGRRVRVALRVARACGQDHSTVGQPRVPGLRRSPGRRAHATVLAPRVRGDRRKSLSRMRRPWNAGSNHF